MSYEGSNCPICHDNKKSSAKPIAIGIVVVGFVVMFGILFYSGGIQIDQENLEESIQSIPDKIPDDLATKISEDLPEIPSEIPQIDEITKKIGETTGGIVKRIEEEQMRIEEEQRISDEKYIQDITTKVHELINEERTSRGLNPLSWNGKLAQAALNHSTDMAKRDYFAHDSPDGQDFQWRYSQVGFSCSVRLGNVIYGGGENIMYLDGYYGVDTIATETVDGWMNSPGHRENILTPYFQSEGIGVVESYNEVYVTQNFC